jgi:leukotriene A-4 hydrolase/aminopeptidase
MTLLAAMSLMMTQEKDVHSYAEPEKVVVEHINLDLTVDFEKKQLRGHATLHLKEHASDKPRPIVLDTRRLVIERCEVSQDGGDFERVSHELGKEDPILGTPLKVSRPRGGSHVRIHYRTSPEASALQWLSPAQTAGKKHPFLFTQSQAIHARSWIPLQDTPAVRVTYSARIQVPRELTALMSAAGGGTTKGGEYYFQMDQPIPSYLIALAVGELRFQRTGKRTGVWAEPSVVAKAAKEFEDMELMLEAVEALYGPYRWERYDVLILPPSAPFGGMENPRMTFASPTVIAGDKSLVALIAHELAHSWSGNLVTNATWRDFWLNEGFTVYLERRILEKVYGPARAAAEAQVARWELEKSMRTMKPQEQVLHIDLKGLDPDENVTDIPYEKGYLFLLHLEKLAGRERFDAFLKGWFDKHAFRSVTTGEFVSYLKANLLEKDATLAAAFPLEEWINQPGLPKGVPSVVSAALSEAESSAKDWYDRKRSLKQLRTSGWTTQQWLYFLRSMPAGIGVDRMRELDEAFKFTASENSEVLCQWLEIAIHSKYEPAYPRLEEFLTRQGRRKFVKPLFEALVKTEEGKRRAREIYAKARAGYHPITAGTVEGLLK